MAASAGRELTRSSSSSSDKKISCMEMLKNLNKEEILEVLSDGFCNNCDAVLQARALSLGKRKDMSISSDDAINQTDYEKYTKTKPVLRYKFSPEPGSNGRAQDGFVSNVSPSSVDSKRSSSSKKYSNRDKDDGLNRISSTIDDGLTEEQERIRFEQVGWKKNFSYIERIKGQSVNVLEGLELHTGVFNSEEQRKIVSYIFKVQRLGQKGHLRARTYSEPRKWMRGKGRITIQFGCCYNYAVDQDGNPPGIVRDEEVDPLPPLFKEMIKRMVRWKVLPSTCVPDSCIVNIYEEGDCIPPHIDHHDFLRPFCTVSFLSECDILFGRSLKVVAPGEFDGPYSIPLPLGSVLILNGNGADVAKHCVPGVPSQRISITFRKMDPSKIPKMHVPQIELMGIKPLTFSASINSSIDVERYEYREMTQVKSSIDLERYEYKEKTDDDHEFPAKKNNNGVDSRNYRGQQMKKIHYW